ncbi:MAG: glycosyltransferase family 39 protein, partial [Anaerolineae bacterium]|nr:glycosyltransferase family 39 protein [Anaerolineae bacterium]
MKTNRLLLLLIVSTYAVLGVLYAAYTPPWQVPDEPAHYNYVRSLAENGAFPVMEMGDYDQEYISQLVGEGFPAHLPIDPITYEDHQLPLYYLLATPVYLVFDGALLPLRLLSVGLGLALLLVVHGLVRILLPEHPPVALLVTALVAFVPQHLAMMAGVENDALAELLVAASLWMALRYVKLEVGGRQFLVGWGLTLGLVLLTKASAYVVLPVALLAVWLRARREGQTLGWMTAQAMWIGLAAALLAGPWFVRNASLYGWADPLGTLRHNVVVVGQPRTAEWIAEYGLLGVAGRMVQTTFRSFWGQFGWMGVPFHAEIYQGLLLLSGAFVAGFVGWCFNRRRPGVPDLPPDALWLLVLSAALTALLFLAYNATFVQHQGRYLFPALGPLALGAALGLTWLFSPSAARWGVPAWGGVGVVLVVWKLVGQGPSLFAVGVAFGLA